MIIKAVALRFGYVESNALSWFVLARDKYEATKFAHSSREALHSVAEFLFQKFGPPANKETAKACCKKSIQKDPDCQYCSKCGKDLSGPGFDIHAWYDFLDDQRHGTIDGSGYMDGSPNPYGWDASAFSFGIPDHQMVVVNENAAQILTLALFEIHPELKDITDDENEVPAFGPENYIWTDYQKLLDDSSGPLPKEDYSETIITDYPNGAVQIVIDGVLDRITYNTGDTVFFKMEDHELKVIGIVTHDGLEHGSVPEEHPTG